MCPNSIVVLNVHKESLTLNMSLAELLKHHIQLIAINKSLLGSEIKSFSPPTRFILRLFHPFFLSLSAGLHGGNQPVQREQEPPQAARRAAAVGQRRGQADAGPRLAAGAQPALAQPLPPY